MTDILARLEAAEAGSHELDLAIAQWCYDGAARDLVNYDPELWLQRNGGFTDSIDAAKALIERVLGDALGAWELTYAYNAEPPHGVRLVIARQGPSEEFGRGNTPALAMCIALIRAKEAKGE